MRNPRPTFDQIDTFVAIARERSFTRAAESLHLSESAVSQHMKHLEALVGTRLFERSPRRPITLTEAGERLLQPCQQMLERLDDALTAIRSADRAQKGVVAFGSRNYFCDRELPTLYAAFERRCPGIELRVERGTREALIEAVMRGRLELAAVLGPVDDLPLPSQVLSQGDFVVVGPPGHRLAGRGSVSLGDLSAERLILGDTPASHWLEHELRDSGLQTRADWSTVTVEAQIVAVQNGLGLASVPYRAARPLLSRGEVALIPVDGFPLRFHRCLVWSNALSGPARQFRDFLLSQRSALESEAICDPGL
jgi:DNA-binding transcriptional LysR family regulator